jgi:large subunit ribosomal protein L18
MHGRAQQPRLNVFRSTNHIYAQIVDDFQGQTLVSASTRDKEIRATLKTGGNIAAAKVVGKTLANRASAAGISRVVFDRGGYAYHGRVKALADAAREAGLKF